MNACLLSSGLFHLTLAPIGPAFVQCAANPDTSVPAPPSYLLHRVVVLQNQLNPSRRHPF